MFRFEHSGYLWLLAIVPVIWLVHIAYEGWRRRRLRKHVSPHLIESLIPSRSRTKSWIKLSIWSVAMMALIAGLANPQFGSRSEEIKRKGIDIMLAIDISNSMLAEDLHPNRLERTKRSVHELLSLLRSDRIGIVVFAGDAFVQLPITTDLSAAKLFLQSIDPGMIMRQGTDIGRALDLCLESFDAESPTSKAIIVISDGENHEESTLESVARAKEMGIIIHTIGMGSPEGAPIPIYQRGTRIGFRQSKEGNTVVSSLNEQMLTDIALETGGTFVRATNAESGMEHIFEKIEELEKVEFGTKVYTDFDDQFQYLLWPALILLVIELIIPNTKSRWWEKLLAS